MHVYYIWQPPPRRIETYVYIYIISNHPFLVICCSQYFTAPRHWGPGGTPHRHCWDDTPWALPEAAPELGSRRRPRAGASSNSPRCSDGWAPPRDGMSWNILAQYVWRYGGKIWFMLGGMGNLEDLLVFWKKMRELFAQRTYVEPRKAYAAQVK